MVSLADGMDLPTAENNMVGGWESFKVLDPSPRDAVLHCELHQLFDVYLATGEGDTYCKLRHQSNESKQSLFRIDKPDIKVFEKQLKYLKTHANLRAERQAEIVAQVGNLVSFFASLGFLHQERSKWSLLLLEAVQRLTAVLEYRVKHHFSSPRPINYAPQVYPSIQTPSHSSFPSGHATESFAIATVLHALMNPGYVPGKGVIDALMNKDSNGKIVPGLDLPFKVAARIAENRTVAGVHFPVDSLAGAIMGIAIGDLIVAHCTGQDTVEWKVYGDRWDADFDIGILGVVLGSKTGAVKKDSAVNVRLVRSSDILANIWKTAQNEWAGRLG